MTRYTNAVLSRHKLMGQVRQCVRLIHHHCHCLRYRITRVVLPHPKLRRPIIVPFEWMRRNLHSHAPRQLMHLEDESLCGYSMRRLLSVGQSGEQFIDLACVHMIIAHALREIGDRALNRALYAGGNGHKDKALSTCDFFLGLCAEFTVALLLNHGNSNGNDDCDYRAHGLHPSCDRRCIELRPVNSIVEQHSNNCRHYQSNVPVHNANHLISPFFGGIVA
ncbi:protein of unknown function [Paraburkholderia dioscoreae]|uniref:Uncharacterized protein n=1 Tax=Paraburkholderia dioscoreae TaxID=2604047 RepID=A0A5Q4ZFQ0_9BURK|nr:protein of unknown function [Paraburkholderia dioscoreae]